MHYMSAKILGHGVVRAMGKFTAKMRRMARDFQQAMNEAADESGVKQTAADLKTMTSAKNLGLDTLKTAADKFEKWQPPKAVTPASGLWISTSRISGCRAIKS